MSLKTKRCKNLTKACGSWNRRQMFLFLGVNEPKLQMKTITVSKNCEISIKFA